MQAICTPPRGAPGQPVIVQAPHDLRYAQNPAIYTVGAPISNNPLFYQGDEALHVEIRPALPDGLVFDPVRGGISGTPTARAPKQTYTVVATNDGGAGLVSIDLTVLDIPTQASLQASGLYRGVTLSWPPLARASSYTVYWNTTGNVTTADQKIANIDGTSFVHIAPKLMTTYYYRVAGVGADGEGELSNEASVSTYGATMVGVGSSHVCATLDAGRVRCWGWGSSGMLGYGNTTDVGDIDGHAINADVPVGGLATQVALGGGHTCALLDTGAVRCWGAGSDGRLGYGDEVNVGDDGHPIHADVPFGPNKAVQITAGGGHSCVLLDNGKVRCWGYGDQGRLGYGGTTSVGDGKGFSIIGAGDVPVGGTVVQISAGLVHTCALLDTGKLRCWGSGSSGRLGYGNTLNVGDDIQKHPINTDVPMGSVAKVVQVTAGGTHTCALLATGAVRCWGANSYGQLGYGDVSIAGVGDGAGPSIANAGDVPVGGTVVQIAAGGNHTCALLATGKVRCWGYNAFGQLGYGNDANVGDGVGPGIADAGDVPVGGRVIQIATGNVATCALLEDARVRCWGNGRHGELGHGSTDNIGDGKGVGIIAAGDVPLFAK